MKDLGGIKSVGLFRKKQRARYCSNNFMVNDFSTREKRVGLTGYKKWGIITAAGKLLE
jgi:hypothetical protein